MYSFNEIHYIRIYNLRIHVLLPFSCTHFDFIICKCKVSEAVQSSIIGYIQCSAIALTSANFSLWDFLAFYQREKFCAKNLFYQESFLDFTMLT